jgi:hypothetical protein
MLPLLTVLAAAAIVGTKFVNRQSSLRSADAERLQREFRALGYHVPLVVIEHWSKREREAQRREALRWSPHRLGPRMSR